MVGKSSEIPCRVSSDPHERRNDLGTVSTMHPVKFELPVKMLVTCARTERPHGALLQLYLGYRYCICTG